MPGRSPFSDVVVLVERAKQELVAAVPSPRGVPRLSVAEALIRFEEGLRAASEGMASWQAGPDEVVWTVCREALDEALRRAERLRLEAPKLDYEGLVGTLGDLIEPLEAFEQAER